MAATETSKELSKPLAGGIFVLFWIIAIVLWIVSGSIADETTRDFIIDVGLIFSCVGFSAPFLPTNASLYRAFLFGLIGIALFAVAGYMHILVVLYFLRIFAPLLALYTPTNKFINNFRVFT